MVKQFKTYKFDENKCNPEMTIDEVIISQYNIPAKNFRQTNFTLKASDLYMPQEEQDKMERWIKTNLKRLKKYPKKIVDKEFQYIKLNIFPSTIEK